MWEAMTMTQTLIIALSALAIIALSEPLSEKLRLATPVILLVIGGALSFLPQFAGFEVDPDLIIEVILPPLLFATAVNTPVQDFRRNLSAITSLAFLLVIASTVALGFVLNAIIPGLGLPIGMAMGAVMSPTDAVATTIVKSQGVQRRIVTILEGEGLINDASALVLLRSALGAVAGSVSLLSITQSLVWSVVGALVVGMIVGHLTLWLRSHIGDARAATILSFIVPFAASIPAEEMHSSGLVAAVVAGLVTSYHHDNKLSPAQRMISNNSWQTFGLIFESLVFLLMGLQLNNILSSFKDSGYAVSLAFKAAIISLLVVTIMRALVVFATTYYTRFRARNLISKRAQFDSWELILDEVDDGQLPAGLPYGPQLPNLVRRRTPTPQQRLERIRVRLDRRRADMQYYEEAHLGYREGLTMVWAGMRGAITLAAAQTFPLSTPNRNLLMFTAFLVAAISLIIQGGTLAAFIRWIKPDSAGGYAPDELDAVYQLIEVAKESVDVPEELTRIIGPCDSHTVAAKLRKWNAHRIEDPLVALEVRILMCKYQLEVHRAEREALVEQNRKGTITSDVYRLTLKLIDGSEMRVETQLNMAQGGMNRILEDEENSLAEDNRSDD